MERAIDCMLKVPHALMGYEVALTVYKGLTFFLSEDVNIKVSETILRYE